MAKDKNKNKDDESKPEETLEIGKLIPSKQLISSKNFIKKLKKELKGVKIPDTVFVVFVKTITPVIDSEENFRKKWKNSFKRS